MNSSGPERRTELPGVPALDLVLPCPLPTLDREHRARLRLVLAFPMRLEQAPQHLGHDQLLELGLGLVAAVRFRTVDVGRLPANEVDVGPIPRMEIAGAHAAECTR